MLGDKISIKFISQFTPLKPIAVVLFKKPEHVWFSKQDATGFLNYFSTSKFKPIIYKGILHSYTPKQ